MAELTCPACGTGYPAGQAYCDRDFAMLVPSASSPVPEPVPAADARCASCDGELVANAVTCDYCGAAVAAAPDGPVGLRGPWGVLELGAEQVVLGRSSPATTIAAALADLDIVSRRHAEIVHRDGAVWLVDLDSANGTYVNDRRLAPHSPIVVRGGDAIRLGSSVHLALENTPTRPGGPE